MMVRVSTGGQNAPLLGQHHMVCNHYTVGKHYARKGTTRVVVTTWSVSMGESCLASCIVWHQGVHQLSRLQLATCMPARMVESPGLTQDRAAFG